MSKHQKYLLLSTIVCFALAIGFDFYTQRTVNTQQYAYEIENYLHKNEAKVISFFSNKELILRQLSNTNTEEDNLILQNLFQEDYTICLYQNDSLVFWSNNNILPNQMLLDDNHTELYSEYFQLSNAHYEILKQDFDHPQLGKYSLFGFIPIKYNFQLESSYLENKFKANPNIPEQIQVSDRPTEVAIKNSYAKSLCFLSANDEFKDPVKQRILFGLYALAFILLAMLISSQAKKIALNNPPWYGFAFLLFCAFGIRFFTLQMNLTNKFNELAIFQPNFESSYLGKSLCDLVINIFLLFWVMVFFHREFRVRPPKNVGITTRYILGTLFYFSITLGILMISNVYRQLVFNTNITFDFDHIFNLDQSSFIAITSSLLLLVALYLFSQRIMDTILKLEIPRNKRIILLTIASLLSVPIILQTASDLPILQMVLIGFMFNLTFDFYVDNNEPSFIWLVTWLVVFAMIPSILLFKYNNDLDIQTRLSYAEKLSEPMDSLVESSLLALKKELQDNRDLKALLKPHPFKADKGAVLKIIDTHFSDDNYLYNNYSLNTAIYTPYGSALQDDDDFKREEIEQKLANANATTHVDLKFLKSEDHNNSYLSNFDVAYNSTSNNGVTVFLDVARKEKDRSKVFTELLIEKQYKNLEKLNNYNYAIFDSNQKLIYKEGKIFKKDTYPFNYIPSLENHVKEVKEEGISNLLYRAENGNIVIISKEMPSVMRIISLFAFLFVLFVFVLIILMVFNSIFNSLPNIFNITFEKGLSIRTRIQLAVIVLTVIFFFSIGFVTVQYFSDERETYHEGRLDRKAKSILTDTNTELETFFSNVENKDKEFNLEALVKRISKIHRMDVNIYNTNGYLITSSEEDVFEKGIIARSMDAIAFNEIAKKNSKSYTQKNEQVGSLTYKAAYFPLNVVTDNQQKTLAYMGLPYYSKQRELRDDVNVFMGTLLNVYVFLLLIAGAIAIGITNSITRPIARIGEKLKEFKLGKRNEPLEWHSKDELGDLIEEYNKMILEVEQSAEKLASQEKEAAWREMAKQVAHEIKNPLTPMKLSIQYLLHAHRSNPENIAPLLKRVSGTLIEQIDNLAAIASEFSNFAKMPRAENQKLIVNDLVNSVFGLFKEGEELMDLELSLPDEQLFVFADKNHLISVLNNLIKNATQAIPDHRRGLIEVSLTEKNNRAVIQVKDNGTGIPEDTRAKVFVPNFTTKNSGTGLGLAISKNIIESVDGKIYFETEIDKGTEFYVELPIVEIKTLEEV